MKRRRTPLLILAALVAAAPARAQSGRQWRPEERMLITRFADVGALAVGVREIYAASDFGLEIYDPIAREWEPPSTAVNGYPAGERPSAMSYDDFRNQLYLATATGGLYTYDTQFGRWTRAATLPAGPVSRMLPDGNGGLFLATPAGWYQLPWGSLLAQPVSPTALPPALRASAALPPDQAAARRDPYLAAMLGTASLDEDLRHWPISDIAPAAEPGNYWIATYGGNLVRLDTHTQERTWLSFGLPTRGAASIARDGRSLWFGGDEGGRDHGVARASADLQQWKPYDARFDGAPNGAVADVLPMPAAVWFAAADGLYRLDRRADRFSRVDIGGYKGGDRVTSLAPARDGVWVGYRDGLALVGTDGAVTRAISTPQPVNQLSVTGDTLWVASDGGLLMLVEPTGPALAAADSAAPHAAADSAHRAASPGADSAGAATPRPPEPPALTFAPGAATSPLVRGRALATATTGGTRFAVLSAGLFRFDGTNWLQVQDPALAAIGALVTLTGGDQLWVAGARGFARLDPASHIWTSYTVGPDLPAGPVWRLLPDGDDVWAATPAGALRLRWKQ